MAYLFLILGIALLIAGGEILVKGAVNIAIRARISTLVVGMTIVSFGTSAPELVVSLKAALQGHPDISIGNVLGSNVANLALVLGLTALTSPIRVDRNSIRFDWPMMLFVTILLYLFMLDLELERWEGIVMFVALILFSLFLVFESRRYNRRSRVEDEVEDTATKGSVWRDVLYIALGAFGLSLGSEWLVDGATEVAKNLGVSDLLISSTIVAFGTSTPELITSITAAVRKETDISIGNLIGSNIFNIAAILGITAISIPVSINQAVLSIDFWWVAAITLLVFPFMLNNLKISRVEGGILFIFYLAYIISGVLFEKGVF
ncbi:calcium/sodium antiporter [Salibacter halophilus]|uniref:Calcium/sodium antiporter n=1 Tax=Salibacter halophilus TaxID=1803916 RepID=A0A6N6M4M4_9FLAO|nr:calcium/sodium antiporter [Salibacter halophilus]KAB1062696.1 calcium/sodium antiporter [Salibacter halophilus]